MTKEAVESLGLGVTGDELTCLMVEGALQWITDNTTYNVDVDNLPPNIKLFIRKFIEVYSIGAGVSSESIEGMSQSFEAGDKGILIRQYARDLIGVEFVSDVKFVQAVRKWG